MDSIWIVYVYILYGEYMVNIYGKCVYIYIYINNMVIRMVIMWWSYDDYNIMTWLYDDYIMAIWFLYDDYILIICICDD